MTEWSIQVNGWFIAIQKYISYAEKKKEQAMKSHNSEEPSNKTLTGQP